MHKNWDWWHALTLKMNEASYYDLYVQEKEILPKIFTFHQLMIY